MWPRRAVWSAVIAAMVLADGVPAVAALTTPTCLARKIKAWGKLRQCQRSEEAKAILGKAFDLMKCQTKFDDMTAKLDALAVEANVACRYRDNGDSTVTDLATGLMWERKNAITVTQKVEWPVAMTDFLGSCNGTSKNGTILGPGCSVYRDWRIPNILELRTLIQSRPGCGTGAAACVDPIFEPTVANIYWSATTNSDNTDYKWLVNFLDGTVTAHDKVFDYSVRAVRSAL